MVPRNVTRSGLASPQADGLAGRAAAGELERGGNAGPWGLGSGSGCASQWGVSLSSLLGCQENLRGQGPTEPRGLYRATVTQAKHGKGLPGWGQRRGRAFPWSVTQVQHSPPCPPFCVSPLLGLVPLESLSLQPAEQVHAPRTAQLTTAESNGVQLPPTPNPPRAAGTSPVPPWSWQGPLPCAARSACLPPSGRSGPGLRRASGPTPSWRPGRPQWPC